MAKKRKPKKWESMTTEQQFKHFQAKYMKHVNKADRRYRQAMDAFYKSDLTTVPPIVWKDGCCASCDGHSCP